MNYEALIYQKIHLVKNIYQQVVMYGTKMYVDRK